MEYVNIVDLRNLSLEEGLLSFRNSIADTFLTLINGQDIQKVALFDRDFFTYLHEDRNFHNEASSNVVPKADQSDLNSFYEKLLNDYNLVKPTIMENSIATLYFKDAFIRIYFSNQVVVKKFSSSEIHLLEADYQEQQSKIQDIPASSYSLSKTDLTISDWISGLEGSLASEIKESILSDRIQKTGYASHMLLNWSIDKSLDQKADIIELDNLSFSDIKQFFQQIFNQELSISRKYLYDEFDINIQLKDGYIRAKMLVDFFITKETAAV